VLGVFDGDRLDASWRLLTLRERTADEVGLMVVGLLGHQRIGQVAMGLAFSHEMGHHLTAEIFDSYKEPGRFLLYTGYAEHLADPVELAADILVSVGTFPAEMAQAFFDTSKKSRLKGAYPRSRGPLSSKIIDYFRHEYGLAFESGLSAEKRLQYLAAVVHYTQLRRALFNEYNL